MLNGKNIKILELLFHENYRLDDLANFLNLNPRTIRYNIKEINSILVEHGLNGIQKERDFLFLDRKEIFKIKKLISSNSTLTSIDRRDYLLTKLLLNHEIILSHESKTLDVTRRTLNNDLIEVKKFLGEYQLIIVAIPGKGVEIYGKAERINALLMAFFTKFLSAGINLKTVFKDIIFSLVEEKKLDEILFKTNIFLNKIDKNPEKYSFYAVISIVILALTSKENKKFLYNLKSKDSKDYKSVKEFFESELNIKLIDEYIYVIIEILNNSYLSDFEKDLKNNLSKFFDEISKKLDLDEQLKKDMISLIRVADYKSRFDISEKKIDIEDLPKDNLKIFNYLKITLSKYFREFQSEDIILMTRFLEDKIKKSRKKVVIVDNSLNQFTGKKIGEFLKEIYDFEIVDYIPHYKLKWFLSQNKDIEMIITLTNLEFEIMDIPVYDIELKRFFQNFKFLDN